MSKTRHLLGLAITVLGSGLAARDLALWLQHGKI
jgi:hypothetical protein